MRKAFVLGVPLVVLWLRPALTTTADANRALYDNLVARELQHSGPLDHRHRSYHRRPGRRQARASSSNTRRVGTITCAPAATARRQPHGRVAARGMSSSRPKTAQTISNVAGENLEGGDNVHLLSAARRSTERTPVSYPAHRPDQHRDRRRHLRHRARRDCQHRRIPGRHLRLAVLLLDGRRRPAPRAHLRTP